MMTMLRSLVGRGEVKLEERLRLRLPIESLWELLTNTQRANAALGFPPTEFREVEGRLSSEASARFLGLGMTWEEFPFEWIEPREFSIERRFRGQLARQVRTGVRLRPLGAGETEATLFAQIEPMSEVGRLLAVLVLGQWNVAQWRRLCRIFEQRYQRREPLLFPPSRSPQVHEDRLGSLLGDLGRRPRIDPGLVARLGQWIREAPDEGVVEMRPFALADQWGTDRIQTLRLFLHATRLGLLDMEWQVLCPNCRIVKANYSTLSDLQVGAHCETCHISFDARFDEYVELRFTVNQRVRPTEGMPIFCVGGPFMTPHIKVQARLAPGTTQPVALPLPPGRYRLRCRGLPNVVALNLVDDGTPPGESALTLDIEGPVAEATLTLRAGEGAQLAVRNGTAREALLIVERDAWDNQGVTAAMVTTLQEFRDLFSSEVLSPGLGIGVKTLTILFSDLKDSTVLYERVGDGRAYAQVRDHFVVLTSVIRDHQGALVKTIGDAVMAVFSQPGDALAAALAAHAAVEALNAAHPERDPLRLKLSLHTGPCIAINANNLIDFFGSTVNIAARALGFSLGGDIILTSATAESATIAAALATTPQVERFTASLKGLTPAFTLYRLWPSPEQWGPPHLIAADHAFNTQPSTPT